MSVQTNKDGYSEAVNCWTCDLISFGRFNNKEGDCVSLAQCSKGHNLECLYDGELVAIPGEAEKKASLCNDYFNWRIDFDK